MPPHFTHKFAVDVGWPLLIKQLGINPREVLRRAKLPDDLFVRRNASLEPQTYLRFWTTLEKVSGDPVFPLKLGQMVSAESFSPPIFAALCSPNFRIAMNRLSQFKPLVGPIRLQVSHTRRRIQTACTMGQSWRRGRPCGSR